MSSSQTPSAGPLGFTSPKIPTSLRTPVQRATASPAIRRLLATRNLFNSARDMSYSSLSDDTRRYFGISSASAFQTYASLIVLDLLTPAELVSAAGSGALLTTLLRSLREDIPDIVTEFDAGSRSRAQCERTWSSADSRLPKWTAAALRRTKDAKDRATVYVHLHPKGDGGVSEAKRQERLWEDAERKVMG
jgi:hypothetical protein